MTSTLDTTRDRALRRTIDWYAAQTAKLVEERDAARAQRDTDHYAATHDTLTGLLNRAGLAEEWAQVDPSGLILLDLNGFKPVNDDHGHPAGDVVLQVIGARLAGLAAATVLLHGKNAARVARLGGDEFVIITGRRVDPEYLSTQVYRLINRPITLPNGVVVTVSASVGVRALDGPTDLGDAMLHADQAMYLAKKNKDTDEDTIAVWTAPVQDREALVGKTLRLRDFNPDHPVFQAATYPVVTPTPEPVTECACGGLLAYELRPVGGVLRQTPVHVDADDCDSPEAATCAHIGCHADHSLDTTCSADRDWCCGRCGCLSDYDELADYYDDLDVE